MTKSSFLHRRKIERLTQPYVDRILTSRVYDVAIESPLERAPLLSKRLGNELWLKREDLQPVFSFKLRGAYNKMAGLSAAQRKKGVIAASAGNHAQGVALSAQKLGCRATIVMPTTTPDIKIRAVAARGARVLLRGDSYSDAYTVARTLANQRGAAFIHPYDDPDVIAGQGTIGKEILQQHASALDAVFVAIGGGGLIAGIAAYIKRLRPGVKIIGVQPVDSDAMARSLRAGRRVILDHVGLFADGVAVKRVGKETFRLCRELVDEVLLVDTDDLCAAIKDVFEETRTILEPAGALAIAGAKQYVERKRLKGKSFVAVACGANMNFDRLRFIAEQAELGERREALFGVTIPERSGSFKAFCQLIGSRHITEFNYRYADAREAHVFAGVQIKNRNEVQTLLTLFRRKGLTAIDLTDNDLAKTHIRHLVGGRAPLVGSERLYRFEFPERPGALMNFLNRISHGWNISLFHYRNQGADYGRVLVGIQVPRNEDARLSKALKDIGYPYWEETKNPAFQLFL